MHMYYKLNEKRAPFIETMSLNCENSFTIHLFSTDEISDCIHTMAIFTSGESMPSTKWTRYFGSRAFMHIVEERISQILLLHLLSVFLLHCEVIYMILSNTFKSYTVKGSPTLHWILRLLLCFD